jgi:hypothetical protein
MTGVPLEEQPLNIKGLLGVGLDGKPDEKRITHGENFLLIGGTRQTHEHMVVTVLRFNEKVDKLGKTLEEVNTRELREIAREVHDESEHRTSHAFRRTPRDAQDRREGHDETR